MQKALLSSPCSGRLLVSLSGAKTKRGAEGLLEQHGGAHPGRPPPRLPGISATTVSLEGAIYFEILVNISSVLSWATSGSKLRRLF